MKYCITLMMLFLTLQGFSEEKPPEQPSFVVETSIAKDRVGINETITLKVTLHYPSGFHPNIDLMKRRLINYAGLYEPPFTLVKVIDHPAQKNDKANFQQLEFIVSPQATGKHFLSLNLISFDSDAKGGKSIEIPSDVYTIDVYIPQATFDQNALIEPPMDLSTDLPITISQANNNHYLKNPLLIAQEAEKNNSFLKNKLLPWISLIAALAVMLVIILIRVLPQKIQENTIDPLTKEQNEIEIKQELQKASLKSPKKFQEATAFVHHIDFLIRKYLQNKYQFPAFSLTAQELVQKISSLKDLSSELKNGINQIFKSADQIKFANMQPTLDECQEIAKTAHHLSHCAEAIFNRHN